MPATRPLLKRTFRHQSFGKHCDHHFPTEIPIINPHPSYTEALESPSPFAFKSPLHTKRSTVNLLLGRYDAAKTDALAALNPDGTPSPHDWKAYYNAGRAAYGLCAYPESHTLLTTALQLNPSNPAIQKEHARCAARLHEESTGEYDFPAMRASLSPHTVHLDRGSFLRNTRVGTSAHHGRGLFATRPIKAGEVVFVEKATLMPNQYDPSRASAALYALMVRQLCENPSLGETVLGLYPGAHVMPYEKSGVEGQVVDGVPVVDVFLVEGIRRMNCFSAPRSTVEDTRPSVPEGRMAKGLWVHASYMNHSCVANTMRSFVGDVLVSRAARDVEEGEELFHQYVPVKAVSDIRNRQFKDGWGFECGCALCAGERKSSEEMLAKRKEKLAAVETLCNKKLPGRELIPDVTIRHVDRLAKQLEELHEKEVYEGLPRLTLIYPCNWLIGAHRGHKNHRKVIKYAIKVLRNFGFRVPEEEGAEWDPREVFTKSGDATLMAIHVVAALRRLAEAYEALGKKEMADRCVEAAQFGYMVVTGFENDLKTLDR